MNIHTSTNEEGCNGKNNRRARFSSNRNRVVIHRIETRWKRGVGRRRIEKLESRVRSVPCLGVLQDGGVATVRVE
jgi:hypothetical protein